MNVWGGKKVSVTLYKEIKLKFNLTLSTGWYNSNNTSWGKTHDQILQYICENWTVSQIAAFKKSYPQNITFDAVKEKLKKNNKWTEIEKLNKTKKQKWINELQSYIGELYKFISTQFVNGAVICKKQNISDKIKTNAKTPKTSKNSKHSSTTKTKTRSKNKQNETDALKTPSVKKSKSESLQISNELDKRYGKWIQSLDELLTMETALYSQRAELLETKNKKEDEDNTDIKTKMLQHDIQLIAKMEKERATATKLIEHLHIQIRELEADNIRMREEIHTLESEKSERIRSISKLNQTLKRSKFVLSNVKKRAVNSRITVDKSKNKKRLIDRNVARFDDVLSATLFGKFNDEQCVDQSNVDGNDDENASEWDLNGHAIENVDEKDGMEEDGMEEDEDDDVAMFNEIKAKRACHASKDFQRKMKKKFVKEVNHEIRKSGKAKIRTLMTLRHVHGLNRKQYNGIAVGQKCDSKMSAYDKAIKSRTKDGVLINNNVSGAALDKDEELYRDEEREKNKNWIPILKDGSKDHNYWKNKMEREEKMKQQRREKQKIAYAKKKGLEVQAIQSNDYRVGKKSERNHVAQVREKPAETVREFLRELVFEEQHADTFDYHELKFKDHTQSIIDVDMVVFGQFDGLAHGDYSRTTFIMRFAAHSPGLEQHKTLNFMLANIMENDKSHLAKYILEHHVFDIILKDVDENTFEYNILEGTKLLRIRLKYRTNADQIAMNGAAGTTSHASRMKCKPVIYYNPYRGTFRFERTDQLSLEVLADNEDTPTWKLESIRERLEACSSEAERKQFDGELKVLLRNVRDLAEPALKERYKQLMKEKSCWYKGKPITFEPAECPHPKKQPVEYEKWKKRVMKLATTSMIKYGSPCYRGGVYFDVTSSPYMDTLHWGKAILLSMIENLMKLMKKMDISESALDKISAIWNQNDTAAAFGVAWDKTIAHYVVSDDKGFDMNMTMEIGYKVVNKLCDVFGILMEFAKTVQHKALMVHWLERVDEFTKEYSTYSQRIFEGVDDPKIEELRKVQRTSFLRCYQIEKDVKPYHYMQYRMMLLMLREHINISPKNRGLMVASCQSLEATNTFNHEEFDHRNGDEDEWMRIITLSDLKRLHFYKIEPKDTLKKMAERILSEHRSIRSEKYLSKRRDLLDNKFDPQWTEIRTKLLSWDWSKEATEDIKSLYAVKKDKKAKRRKRTYTQMQRG